MDNWQEGRIPTNGIQIAYHRTGGDKPPVVMAHGITDSGLCWTRTARMLQDEYDVIMVDARGHGRSDRPEGGYAPSNHAADLAGLISGLGLERPGVIGHSMGAATATTLAAQYPAYVSRVILEDPPWRADHPHMRQERAQRMRDWAQDTRERAGLPVEEIIRQGKETNPTWHDDEFLAWAAAKKLVGPHIFSGAPAMQESWQKQVARIECPTLLITGDVELGGIVSQDMAAHVQQQNPRIEVTHIPDAGHNIRRMQFDAFMTAIREFLARTA